MDASIAANMLFDSGYSDTEIAEMVGVTREYINKVRNGKKTASVSLGERLHRLVTQGEDTVHTEYETVKPRVRTKAVQEDLPQEETAEEGSTVWDTVLIVGGGLFFGLAILGAILKGLR